MQTLVIKESNWIHGNPTSSTLLDLNGCMCCLGFYAKALGACESAILNHGTPAASPHLKWHPILLDQNNHSNSEFCRSIIKVNDSPETRELFDLYKDYTADDLMELIPLDLKKQMLTEKFAQMDIKLEFVP